MPLFKHVLGGIHINPVATIAADNSGNQFFADTIGFHQAGDQIR